MQFKTNWQLHYTLYCNTTLTGMLLPHVMCTVVYLKFGNVLFRSISQALGTTYLQLN